MAGVPANILTPNLGAIQQIPPLDIEEPVEVGVVDVITVVSASTGREAHATNSRLTFWRWTGKIKIRGVTWFPLQLLEREGFRQVDRPAATDDNPLALLSVFDPFDLSLNSMSMFESIPHTEPTQALFRITTAKSDIKFLVAEPQAATISDMFARWTLAGFTSKPKILDMWNKENLPTDDV